jgi:hypothetical protein
MRDKPIDGQAEAIKLLRALKKLNLHRERPVKSADVVTAAFRASLTWDQREQRRFARIVANWLSIGVVDGSCWDLDDYEHAMAHGWESIKAERDRAYQDFINEQSGESGTTTTH